jgi:hypothetical protein
MTIRRIAAGVGATAAILTGLVVATVPAALADDCYEVGFERTPSAGAQTSPPKVSVDDGDPYYRVNPGACF